MVAFRVSPNSKRRRPISERKKKKTKKEDRDLFVQVHQSSSPNLLNLPSDLLQLISDRISSSYSIPDLLSFSATQGPPEPSSMSCIRSVVIIPNNLDPLRTFRSPISKLALNRRCCGCSYGHLIFGYFSDTDVLIADIFSPAQYRLPQPPRLRNKFPIFSHAVLTAPPSSPSSLLYLVCSPQVYCWTFRSSPQSGRWSVITLDTDRYATSVTLFNGMLHLLHEDSSLFAVQYAPRFRQLRRKRLPDAHCSFFPSYSRLAECDGELLLVCVKWTENKDFFRHSIRVFKLDLGGEGAWLRVDNIGDWCIFMDFVDRCPFALPQPAKWGGRTNCVYFPGPQFDSWSVLPLDGTVFNHGLKLVPSSRIGLWPSPAWVYPSTLLSITRDDKKSTKLGLRLNSTKAPSCLFKLNKIL